MVGEARGLAAELVAQPPRGLSGDQVAEAIDLLNWLADDHFTFLGYRKYQLTGQEAGAGDLMLVEEAGTGLGLYIARELCEASGASLELLDDAPGAHFRISAEGLVCR